MRNLYVVALAAAAIACSVTFADAKSGGGNSSPQVMTMTQSGHHPTGEAGGGGNHHSSPVVVGSSSQAFDPTGVSHSICPAVMANPGHYASSTWAFCTNQPYPTD